jgi:DNA-binding Lrp family transcriptional regulator
VAKYLKWLDGKLKDSPKKFFRVVPEFDEAALGLNTVDVFLKTDNYESIRNLEQLCDEHPYTKYRARSYGGIPGLFAQFRIPFGSHNRLRTLLESKINKRHLDSFWILPTANTQPIFSIARLEHWNNNSFTWDFDWSSWIESDIEIPSAKKTGQSNPRLDLLSKKDMYILSDLVHGARRKQKEIIDKLSAMGIEFTSQEFSRRLRVLQDYFIQGYHVFIDPEAFDLYSNVILTANVEERFALELQAKMLSDPIPFRSTLKIQEEFLFWYLRLPPSHMSRVLEYVHSNSSNLMVSLVDYENTEVYGIWPETFDEESKSWITSSEFMVNFKY